MIVTSYTAVKAHYIAHCKANYVEANVVANDGSNDGSKMVQRCEENILGGEIRSIGPVCPFANHSSGCISPIASSVQSFPCFARIFCNASAGVMVLRCVVGEEKYTPGIREVLFGSGCGRIKRW